MKKILCLFAVLLMFVWTSFAFAQDDFLNYVQKKSVNFKLKQEEYYKNSLAQSENEKEQAFKKLYTNYIDYYRDISRYYNEQTGISFDFDYDYVKTHKDQYLEYGLGFNIPEYSWEAEEDYTMLLNTRNIPGVWSEWLKLQQKYVVKNRKTCIKLSLRDSYTCEGGTMTISEREQAIVDLSKIEQKSEAIRSVDTQDFDYIPYTSQELLYTYLLGNDLKPVYESDLHEIGKNYLNKTSKKSFEHFIKHHKDSKYWNIVNEYYEMLKQNNFIYSENIADWLTNKLEDTSL